MQVGFKIAKLRKEKGLTQAELGEKIYVSPKTISAWEKGRNLPDLERLIELSNVLECNIEDILDLNEKSKDELKKEYSKKEKKKNILMISFFAIIAIIAVGYFLYNENINYKASLAYYYSGKEDIVNMIKMSYKFSNTIILYYFIYILSSFISYVLYILKNKKFLLVISIILALCVLDLVIEGFSNPADIVLVLISFVINTTFYIILKLKNEKNVS